MLIKYLIRLDDACPYMDSSKWDKVEKILLRYKLKPLVGVIPCNEDKETMFESEDLMFWEKVKMWQESGWVIALHGYNHCCVSKEGGINPIHKRSEFAGLPYELQENKIRKGYEILKYKGLKPTYFFAPSHTYDDNTIKAIRNSTPIRLLSDTMSRFPYKYADDFVIVPCQMGVFRKIFIPGFWTFCFHPNNMDDKDIKDFEEFIKKNIKYFIPFSEVNEYGIKKKNIIDKLMSMFYLFLRKIKN